MHFRLHLLALFPNLVISTAVGGLGVALALIFQQPAWLGLLALACLLAAEQVISWSAFHLRVEHHRIIIHRLQGIAVTRRVFPLSEPGGLVLRQTPVESILDIGTLRIESLGTPVQIDCLTPFSRLRGRIERG